MDTCFPIVSEGDALVLALEQEDRAEGRPDELYEAAELRFHIDKMLYQITPREKQTLRLRFGMCKEGEKTLEQVGDILDVNRERARQIEAKALRRIRGHYLSKNLKQWACGVT